MAIMSASLERAKQVVGSIPEAFGVASLSFEDLDFASTYAADSITSMARQMMLENYSSSGINDRTGKLRNAIARSEVSAVVAGGGDKIKKFLLRVKMPVSPETHKGQTADQFYAMAGALQYGAVRFPKKDRKMRDVVDVVTGAITGVTTRGPMGARAKRSIKKLALTGKISNRARMAIEKGKTVNGRTVTEGYALGTQDFAKIRTDGAEKSVYFSSGVVVVAGRKFFYLTPSQSERLSKAFLDALQFELKNLEETRNGR
jgi:hypothetical protein